jgi:hypothetical protein
MPKFVKKYTETQYFTRGFLRRIQSTYSRYSRYSHSLYNFNTETDLDFESNTELDLKEKRKTKYG